MPWKVSITVHGLSDDQSEYDYVLNCIEQTAEESGCTVDIGVGEEEEE